MEAALKKEITQGLDVLEKTLVDEVSSKGISCWGWTLRISRNKTPQTPAKPADSQKSEKTEQHQNEAESV